MLPTSHLVAFLVTAFVVIVIPGPSVLFTVGRALTLGRTGALLTVVGNSIGVYVQVILVAFGLGAIVEKSVAAYTVVKFAGAAYLIYLGVQAIRHRRRGAVVDLDAPAEPVPCLAGAARGRHRRGRPTRR